MSTDTMTIIEGQKRLDGHADPDKMARVYYRKRRVVEPIA